MAAKSIPDRIVWAVEMLDLHPSDHVLEIGCGHGLALSPIWEKLGRGQLTAIDRSALMIERARKRNRAHVESGKVQFRTVALADADLGRQRFAWIFAIHVNLFWIDPSRELPIVKKLLRRAGSLHLFYQPPRTSQLRILADKLRRNLECSGFVIRRIVPARESSARTLCVIAGSPTNAS